MFRWKISKKADNLSIIRKKELFMYTFPKSFYTDVRIETVFQTQIQVTLGSLENMKETEYKAAFIRLYNGDRWFFSATTDLESIQSEIERLASLAEKIPDITTHQVVQKLEVNTGDHCRYQGDISVRNTPLSEKYDMVSRYFPRIEGKEYVKMWRCNYVDRNIKKQFYSSKGSDLSWDFQRLGFRFHFELSEGEKKFGDRFDVSDERFAPLQGREKELDDVYREAVKFLLEAEEVEAGEYPVVLSPETAGVFAHESFGHKSEADFMLGDETMRKEWKIGKKVGADILNIIDTGEEEGSGYVPFDDEGSRCRKTYLVKKGVLSGRLHSALTAAALDEELTGNARAVNFEYEPIVRMTSTYIGGGEGSFEDLISDIEDGVYIDNINHGSGLSTFTIAPCRAYRIRKGRIDGRLKVSVVTGNVFKTLNDIEGVSETVELKSFILGGCGKMEQFPLPVGFGGPYVRVKSLNVS
jgi:TldD protein